MRKEVPHQLAIYAKMLQPLRILISVIYVYWRDTSDTKNLTLRRANTDIAFLNDFASSEHRYMVRYILPNSFENFSSPLPSHKSVKSSILNTQRRIWAFSLLNKKIAKVLIMGQVKTMFFF
ncbi:hypothetical protein A7Q10_03045 [Methylacidiphilum caldifontis]|uniref:Uncharacterized protein n=1 Tax=Methylacidiphilum caldifontis TaxID=2795386 RepID=A0A4Y8P6L7_9BACT|nr:hypothetical protein A7Q10_03045 [Methylacidiphilum caldifontis]